MDHILQNAYHVWGVIAGIGSIVFGAGMVVEKLKTDRFVTKSEFSAYKETFETKLDVIKDSVDDIKVALGVPPRIILP